MLPYKERRLHLLGLFLAQLIQAEEEITHCHKANQQNEDPLEHTTHALSFQVHKEIGIDFYPRGPYAYRAAEHPL